MPVEKLKLLMAAQETLFNNLASLKHGFLTNTYSQQKGREYGCFIYKTMTYFFS